MSPVDLSAITLVSLYLYGNVLLAAAATALVGIRALSRVLPQPMTYRHILATGRILAVVALIIPILPSWHGRSELSAISAQVWAWPSMTAGMATAGDDARIAVGIEAIQTSLGVSVVKGVTLMLFLGGFLVVLLHAFSQARSTFRSIRNAQVLRSVRSVRILISDIERVPFALWIPGRSYIVLPSTLVLCPADVRMALRHEGQHHRQRDTRYVYLTLLGRALFGVNPAVHWLAHQLNELQELACDEALARRPDHCRDAYCACLLRVAESAIAGPRSPLSAFMIHRQVNLLRRRIEAALQPSSPPLRATAATSVGLVAAALLAALGALIVTPIHDRRVSRADAEQLVATTPGSATWGLRVNDAVLRQLNLLLGTPDGRIFLMASIARMRTYEPGVLTELQKYGLPSALAAVPLVESGYQNRPQRSGVGAGLWMFIRSTARRYGLEVSGQHDERLNVSTETRAAAQMFAHVVLDVAREVQRQISRRIADSGNRLPQQGFVGIGFHLAPKRAKVAGEDGSQNLDQHGYLLLLQT